MSQDIRPLTREEQLQWLIPFLKSQMANLQQDLDEAEKELQEIQQSKQLVLKKEYNNNERR